MAAGVSACARAVGGNEDVTLWHGQIRRAIQRRIRVILKKYARFHNVQNEMFATVDAVVFDLANAGTCAIRRCPRATPDVGGVPNGWSARLLLMRRRRQRPGHATKDALWEHVTLFAALRAPWRCSSSVARRVCAGCASAARLCPPPARVPKYNQKTGQSRDT